MLTRETIWQACFNEALPDELKECKNQEFNNGVFDRLARVFNEVRPNDPTASAEGMTLLATGISMEKTLASLRGPVVLTLADFNNIPTLTPASRLGTLQEVEQSLAKDLKRRGTHNSLPDYMPTISFGVAGGAAETVNIQDTSGMDPQDLANFNAGALWNCATGMKFRLVRSFRAWDRAEPFWCAPTVRQPVFSSPNIRRLISTYGAKKTAISQCAISSLNSLPLILTIPTPLPRTVAAS